MPDLPVHMMEALSVELLLTTAARGRTQDRRALRTSEEWLRKNTDGMRKPDHSGLEIVGVV